MFSGYDDAMDQEAEYCPVLGSYDTMSLGVKSSAIKVVSLFEGCKKGFLPKHVCKLLGGKNA